MARNRYDTARMQGIQAAMTLARRLDLRDRVLIGPKGYVDVFEIIEELDIPFSFVELDKALGFCLPHPRKGIAVTTKASLHRQRFTAAHELGHTILEHEGSVDAEILMRGGQSMTGGDLIEIEAEAFAAELLLPKWLLVHHMRRRGWTIAKHMPNAEVVYQLALRVSASYTATCWSLFGNDLLPNRGVLDDLLIAGKRLGKVKQSTMRPLEEKIGHGNAWRFDSADSGDHYWMSSKDLIRVELLENIGSGYVWESEAASESGFEVRHDDYDRETEERVGSPARRRLTFSPPEGAGVELMLSERRPWERSLKPANVFGLTLDVLGREKRGISRARRKMLGLEVV